LILLYRFATICQEARIVVVITAVAVVVMRMVTYIIVSELVRIKDIV